MSNQPDITQLLDDFYHADELLNELEAKEKGSERYLKTFQVYNSLNNKLDILLNAAVAKIRIPRND